MEQICPSANSTKKGKNMTTRGENQKAKRTLQIQPKQLISFWKLLLWGHLHLTPRSMATSPHSHGKCTSPLCTSLSPAMISSCKDFLCHFFTMPAACICLLVCSQETLFFWRKPPNIRNHISIYRKLYFPFVIYTVIPQVSWNHLYRI